MRDLKFRAWDNKKKSFIEIYQIQFSHDNTPLKIIDCEDSNIYKDDYVLMQYTGLKDKNGKEIYEGDIVKITSGGYGNIYEVKFEFGCFYAGWHNGSSTTKRPKLIVSRFTEIIGNIYENQKLLHE